MRYLLFASTPWASDPANPAHHAAPDATQTESAVAFCAQLEDELAASSELESYEVLAPRPVAHFIGPDGSLSAHPHGNWVLGRVWMLRVAGAERANELAARIARELAARVEVRECLTGAQRP